VHKCEDRSCHLAGIVSCVLPSPKYLPTAGIRNLTPPRASLPYGCQEAEPRLSIARSGTAGQLRISIPESFLHVPAKHHHHSVELNLRLRQPWGTPSRKCVGNLVVQASSRIVGSRGQRRARLSASAHRNCHVPSPESRKRLGRAVSVPRRWRSTKFSCVPRNEREEIA
jgi:hypothetical protein